MGERVHPKRKEAIILLNEAGWCDSEIAHALKTQAKTIFNWRKRLGLDAAPTKYAAKIDHQKAQELHQMGWSDGQIARHFKADQSTVTKWRHRNGLERNFDAVRPMEPETRKQARSMLAAGTASRQIAERLGLSQGTVLKIRATMSDEGLRPLGVTDATIRARLRSDKNLMPRLHKAIGENVPMHIREHAVHDMYCDLFDCVLSADQIEKRAPSYRSAAYKMCGDSWTHSRLDEEDENGLSLMDTLTNDEWDPQEGW